MSFAHVRALVLDATPLITQPYTHYQNFAEKFYTTPTIIQEIKDAQARKNLEIWQSVGNLHLIHPSEESIRRVSQFAKLTGDYSVLSANDIHILALAYQLEVQLNKGDWRLRKKPGDKLAEEQEQNCQKEEEEGNTSKKNIQHGDEEKISKKDGSLVENSTISENSEITRETINENTTKKKRRRGGKRQREKREARLAAEASTTTTQIDDSSNNKPAEVLSVTNPSEVKDVVEMNQNIDVSSERDKTVKEDGLTKELEENYLEDDDDGEWITPDTLTEALLKDSGEDTVGSRGVEVTEEQRKETLNLPNNQVALATGDFAIQNVALQLNLNLMNFHSGLRIKRLRNYMLRCHACFQMFPLPKDGKQKHFCPSCGGQGTLLRCAVSVDARTGKITPHLKANFQWNNRGNRYSIASPLSKNSQKKYGKKGFDHSKQNQDVDLLREDQKEYEQLMKQEEWTRRHNEKVLNNWIGGGSADNYISPFAITGLKHHSVRVGRGRHANSSRRKK